MKKLLLAVPIILLLVTIVATGCGEKEPPVIPEEGEEVVSSCVSCHTNKDLLKEVAKPEEELKSEATSGEG